MARPLPVARVRRARGSQAGDVQPRARSPPGIGAGLCPDDQQGDRQTSILNKRWWMIGMIAVILGVFAYSFFINVQRDENRDAANATKGIASG
jgi:hypothetical protein